eukprot:scaffold1500_cov398-Prasinococcus_capsulatus_cf.AAC.23
MGVIQAPEVREHSVVALSAGAVPTHARGGARVPAIAWLACPCVRLRARRRKAAFGGGWTGHCACRAPYGDACNWLAIWWSSKGA